MSRKKAIEIIAEKRYLVIPEHVIEGEVKSIGNTGRVNVPKEWIGKKVIVIVKGEE
jgi:putative transposon-encoded protein